MKIIYGQDGFVTRVIIDASADFDINDHLQAEEQAIDGIAEPGLDKVVNGVLVPAPARPSNFHTFDKPSFAWVLNLSAAKTSAKARITKARNAEELQGFTAYGKTFDSDADSQRRILVAVNTAQVVGESFSIDWTCKDNSTILLDYWMVQALPAVMANAANTLHVKARSLKAQIELASTLEELVLITW